MSNYCTNCKWLGKESIANKTQWYCTFGINPNDRCAPLQSLCGNPRKAIICEEQNWYESKNKSGVKSVVTEYGRAMQFVMNKISKQQEKEMTTEEMIKVMQAYVDGKSLQYRNKKTGMDWKDVTNPVWEWCGYEYRIKPEPKYRPLKPKELVELVGTVIVDLDGDQYVVGGSKFYDGQILVFVFQSWVNSSYLLKNFKYKDGTPCGKLEE